jgi:ABC-2 type transport system ATP-binding protein
MKEEASMDAIRTENLTKQFDNIIAIDQLNWRVPEGSLCGFLGPNGAGKTTTLKILLGIAFPTSGSARVRDLDASSQSVEIHRLSAYVAEDKVLYDNFKASTFVQYYSSFFPDWSQKIFDEISKAWQFPFEQKIGQLSKGTRAKLWLAVSLARKPALLFLDEPTEGLDPVSQEEILELLTHWLAEGKRTAIIASHRLEEIERVCDRVAILNRGKLLINGDLEDMKQEWKTIEIAGDFTLEPSFEGLLHITKSGVVSRIVTSQFSNVMQKLKQSGQTPLHVYDMNLREIYLASLRKGGIDYGSLEELV